MNDEQLLAQASDSIQQQQRAHPAPSEPKPIKATVDRLMARIEANREPTEMEIATEKHRERVRESSRREGEWLGLARRIGRRYAVCALENFQADTGPQTLALESMRGYAAKLTDNLRDGRGVLLYGPPGTGKDHLATALMRSAVIDCGAKVEWADGADFYGSNRDNIDGNKSEAAHLERFRSPDLLVLSDPIPPRGGVESAYQLSMLFRVIDRRYRDMKATVVTLNVADRSEAEKRLSPNIIDRLAHGALAIHCNWPSFRK